MSFQLGATADKASDIRKHLTSQRDRQLKALPDDLEENDAGIAENERIRDELEGELADAGIAGIAAAARELKHASGFQVTVSGHRNPDGQMGLSMAINASP